MTKDQIIGMQKMLAEAGFDPGQVDGIAGPRTEAAWKDYEASKKAAPVKPASKWPAQKDVPAHFGAMDLGKDGKPSNRWQSKNLTSLRLPYPMRLSWDTGIVVRSITCHRSVARDLSAILGEILAHYGSAEAVKAARMDLYGGCYNFRRMRGGSALSMHSYGIAIDIDPEKNPLGAKWKANSGMMPEAVIAIFENHGWTWGGHWKSPSDPQHFQAAHL